MPVDEAREDVRQLRAMAEMNGSVVTQLRDYETDWLRRIEHSRARRRLIVGPPGVGKTVIAAELIRRSLRRHEKVLFLVHRRELASQAVKRLHALGVPPYAIGVMLGSIARSERDTLIGNVR